MNGVDVERTKAKLLQDAASQPGAGQLRGQNVEKFSSKIIWIEFCCNMARQHGQTPQLREKRPKRAVVQTKRQLSCRKSRCFSLIFLYRGKTSFVNAGAIRICYPRTKFHLFQKKIGYR